MNNEEPNFFNAQTIVAILLVGLTFVGWQMYMQKKYPNMNKKPVAEAPAGIPGAVEVKPTDEKNPVASNTTMKPSNLTNAPEKLTSFQSENLSFDISSRGMGLKNVRVHKFKDRKGGTVELGHPEESALSFETRLLGREEALPFSVEKVNDRLFVGRATVGKLQVAKTMEIIPEKYLVEYKVQVTGEDDRFVGLTTYMTEDVVPHPPDHGFFSSFLAPPIEKQEFYIDASDTHDRLAFTQEDLQKSWSRVKVASIGSQYFTQAILDKSTVLPEVKGRTNHQNLYADLMLQYTALNKGAPFDLNYQGFVGPKSHQLLSAVDENLGKVVDFGFFHWIGRHILDLLKWFFSLTSNWGWSIILMTIVVRICLLPFNVYSFKSMKAMQAIQPQIQAMREKYKDDQVKQQQEMMALMKTNKVNPLGGCLPVFLQFPIFIALYQMLGNSIELYQAPFTLWIYDLSLKDPFYILPVLMGVTMFMQQKLTPNTMDPAQAKIMLMMPLIFTFFMVSLPSGLTLYMWVGAVFSVLQQLYFLRATPKPLVSQGA